MFNERKTAQMATFFLAQSPDQSMAHLKLMKLLYLAEREAVRRFGMPMSGDRFVSMPHGPVLSMTLNLMGGDVESGPDGWEAWISDKENHEVSLRKQFLPEELDELSKAELAVLESVWKQFGKMGKWEIRDWTHEHCAEWQDPKGSSWPISFVSLACAVGFDKKTAQELAANFEQEQDLDKLFAAL
jgi:uncharacterized phage-associated protein